MIRPPSPRPSPRLALLAPALAAALAACADPSAAPAAAGDPGETAAGPAFVDAAAAAGLDFVHFNGASDRWYMVEILGAGAALFDYDGDGDLDAYLVQGEMLGPGATLDDALHPPRSPLTDRLYRNDSTRGPDGRARLAFTDVSEESGVAALGGGYGMGVATGDYDDDGDVDLYVTNFGPNRLLENRGDGTFADATREAGVGDDRWSVPAAFFDYDGDGRLDLYVGNYVAFDFARLPVCRDLTGAQDYCGPKVFPSEPDRLFRNRGDGTFEDVTRAAGMTSGFGPALGAVTADFDGDHDLDLYVANDAKPNNLWLNQGDGTFRDEALFAGAALDEMGRAQGSMGVDAGDYDGDGDLDLFMTHLSQETNTLYRNDGRGLFVDWSSEAGLATPGLAGTAFGTAWFDYDNDGWLDLFVANGAVTKILSLVRQGDPFPFHQQNQLFRNLGGEAEGGEGEGIRFAEVTADAGPALALSEVSRAAAFGDVDDDGDVDVLVTNNDGPVRLLVNQVGSRRPWLGARLLAAGGVRDAHGARAAVVRGGRA
ncbi:MAG TPA: VCBS repeat-containing protein, partial [Thermoanaerobaculia bacterium]|nr:VCBS repeat-containing protein [Thermoanaerobaculia bacterium]